MSKRMLQLSMGALLIFFAGIGVGIRIGDDEATTTTDDEETADARRPLRRSSPIGPSFDQWIGSAGPRPSNADEAAYAAAEVAPRELDGGMPGVAAQTAADAPPVPTSVSASSDSLSDPDALRQAESTIATALARGTLTADDRAQISGLLADISNTDRDRLTQQILGALSEGRLRLDANL